MKKEVIITDEDCMGQDEWWCYWYTCKKCKETRITDVFKYCPMCGSKLKFEVTDEYNDKYK